MNNKYKNRKYLDVKRLKAYIEQYKYIDIGHNILEVGNGAGVFGDIVKKITNYKSIDIDSENNPDSIADITDLEQIKHLKNQFDVVFCCQVLEHIPFEKVPQAFHNILNLGAKRVVISVPDNRKSVRLKICLHKFNINKVFSIPRTVKKFV